jgi:hypothetical protein
VWIQSLPISELAGKIAEYLPSNKAGTSLAAAVAVGMLSKK